MTLLESEVKSNKYNSRGPNNGGLPKRRRPERCNKDQRIADVGKQDPGEITLYIVDLVGANAPFDLFVMDRIIRVAENLRN